MRNKLIRKHSKNCGAVGAVEAGHFDDPWGGFSGAIHGSQSHPKEPGSFCWFVFDCSGHECKARLAILANDIFAMTDDYKKTMKRRRIKQALKTAKELGELVGRPRLVPYDTIRQLHRDGRCVKDISKTLRISARTISRALREVKE